GVDGRRETEPRVGYVVRRRTETISRQHVALCAAICRTTGETRCRSCHRFAAERRDRATRHAWRRQIDRRDRDRGLSFSAAALCQNWKAILPGLRFPCGKAESGRDRETNRDGGEKRRTQGARAGSQSTERISHRRRALGGAASL